MQKSSEGAQFIERLIKLITDGLIWMWRFSVDQFVTLANQPWGSLPWWKFVVLLVIALIILGYLWSYALAFAWRLWGLVVGVGYALVGVFALGLVALAANWFVRSVHIPALDRLIAWN